MSIEEDIENLIWEVERRTPWCNKKLKEYSDRNLKDKLWYKVCESVVMNCGVSFQLNRNQKKSMIIFLFILLGIMLMMLIYWAEAYIL
jgi:hypothetical protein